MTEISREDEQRLIKTCRDISNNIIRHIEPLILKYGSTEAVIGMMLACKQMESFFTMSHPNAEKGLDVMRELAEELHEVEMQIYEERLRASSLGAHIKTLMESVGTGDKL
jgi:hypothetical protein